MLRNSFFLAVFVMAYGSAAQQLIQMDESDVKLEVLTWHYDKYEKSEVSAWSVIAKDGIGYFKADFLFDGEQFEAIYNDEGYILSETQFFPENRIPDPVITLLDYRIVKYKIVNFSKRTNFESRKEQSVNYRVEAKTKTGGQVIYWFDQDFNLLPDKRDELAIR